MSAFGEAGNTHGMFDWLAEIRSVCGGFDLSARAL